MAWLGAARRGMAWRGWHGLARQGEARQGMARLAWHGGSSPGEARRGEARTAPLELLFGRSFLFHGGDMGDKEFRELVSRYLHQEVEARRTKSKSSEHEMWRLRKKVAQELESYFESKQGRLFDQ